ncbi:MAG: SDR family oxidoreductase [Verrucomicrobia bacterium]|nr:SDR family oxidoreductase [Verrucomicrobiota bacterium]
MNEPSPVSSVLVTGANGSIGLACARMFLQSWPGARVYLGCRAARVQAAELAAEFAGRCELVSLEVTDAESWAAVVQRIVAASGRLDVLVNNAGQHRDALLATMPLEDWHAVLATNLTGTFLGCRAVVRTMLAQRHGRIINIASLSALLAPAGQTNYAAAKAGVVALTQALAKEVARAGITVNALCPGYVMTAALAQDPAQVAELAKRVPARRLGRPEEVAAAVRYLAGPDAAYTTGAVLKLDGGIF